MRVSNPRYLLAIVLGLLVISCSPRRHALQQTTQQREQRELSDDMNERTTQNLYHTDSMIEEWELVLEDPVIQKGELVCSVRCGAQPTEIPRLHRVRHLRGRRTTTSQQDRIELLTRRHLKTDSIIVAEDVKTRPAGMAPRRVSIYGVLILLIVLALWSWRYIHR